MENNEYFRMLFDGWFLERKICNLLAYLADIMLKKLRGSGQLYLVNVKIVHR